MAAPELAGIVDILPATPPPAGGGTAWWLLALPPLLWGLWRYWQRRGRWRWRLWRLPRRVRAGRLDPRQAADLLWRAYRQRRPGADHDTPLRAAFDRARFAAQAPDLATLQRLLQGVRDAG